MRICWGWSSWKQAHVGTISIDDARGALIAPLEGAALAAGPPEGGTVTSIP